MCDGRALMVLWIGLCGVRSENSIVSDLKALEMVGLFRVWQLCTVERFALLSFGEQY